MELSLTLDYDLAPGWRAPWVLGLRRGTAIGAGCARCGRVSFPPLRICPCGGSGGGSGGWVTLSGVAVIEQRTTGTDGDFALARFEGAAIAAVVRLDGIGPEATRGRLRPSPGPVPQIVLGALEEDS